MALRRLRRCLFACCAVPIAAYELAAISGHLNERRLRTTHLFYRRWSERAIHLLLKAQTTGVIVRHSGKNR